MLRGTENVAVIDSFVVDKNDFLSAYKLSKESGTISMSEDGSGTSFINELGDKMIFTQASGDGETHLYSRIKLIDKWEDAKLLEGHTRRPAASALSCPVAQQDRPTHGAVHCRHRCRREQ